MPTAELVSRTGIAFFTNCYGDLQNGFTMPITLSPESAQVQQRGGSATAMLNASVRNSLDDGGGTCARSPGQCLSRISFRILGSIEVWAGEHELELGGPRQVALLAFLLLHANRAAPRDAVNDAVWPRCRPGSDNRLAMAIGRLRRALGPVDRDGSPRLRVRASVVAHCATSGCLLRGVHAATDPIPRRVALGRSRDACGRRAATGTPPPPHRGPRAVGHRTSSPRAGGLTAHAGALPSRTPSRGARGLSANPRTPGISTGARARTRAEGLTRRDLAPASRARVRRRASAVSVDQPSTEGVLEHARVLLRAPLKSVGVRNVPVSTVTMLLRAGGLASKACRQSVEQK